MADPYSGFDLQSVQAAPTVSNDPYAGYDIQPADNQPAHATTSKQLLNTINSAENPVSQPLTPNQISNQFLSSQKPAFMTPTMALQYQGAQLGQTPQGRAALSLAALPIAAADIPALAATSGENALMGISKLLGRIGTQTGIGTGLGMMGNYDPNKTLGQNALQNAMPAAGMSSAFEGVPLIGKAVGAITSPFRPQAHADQIIQQLGNGMSLSDNAKSLAADVKSAYDPQKEAGQALYDPVFKGYGGSNEIMPDNYLGIDQSIFNTDLGLKKLNNAFSKNPSLDNAHTLQSELGYVIRPMQIANTKGTLSQADRLTMQQYQEAQDSLKQDIYNSLSKKDPNLADQYDSATDNWVQNVIPYKSNPVIAKMATGDKSLRIKPNTVTNVFSSPNEDIQKVVFDIGPQANNKILYSALGKANLGPEDLADAAKPGNMLDTKGLLDYATPEFKNQLNSLGTKVMLQKGLGGLGGALTMAHVLGESNPLAEMLGGGGGVFLPKLINKIPVQKTINALRPAYGPLGRAAINNAMLYGQGQ